MWKVWLRSVQVSSMKRCHVSIRTETTNVKSYNEIPGPLKLPFIGSMWQFIPFLGEYDKLRIDVARRKRFVRFGNVVKEKFGSQEAVFLYDPKDIETMFRNEGKQPKRFILQVLRKYRESRPDVYSSGGILTVSGQEWYDLRSKAQRHMLRPKAVAKYMEAMDVVAREFVELIGQRRDSQQEVPETFLQDIYNWALESIAMVALDARLGCLNSDLSKDSETSRFISVVNESLELVNAVEFGLRLFRFFPTPKYLKLCRKQDYFTEVAMKYVNRALERLKQRSPDDANDRTLLETLLSEPGAKPKDVVLMTMDMLLAGIDTTSHSMAFLLYLLAKNPQKQEILREAVNKILPSPDIPITPQITESLPYVKACVKESMRIFPIIDGTMRILDNDVVVGGYNVPAGIPLVAMNRIPCMLRQHFEEPHRFKPERWLKENKNPDLHPYAFLPFGHGPRMCIGRRFAEQEIYLLLIRLMQRYRIEYHYEDIYNYTKFVNVPDKPLKLKFIDLK